MLEINTDFTDISALTILDLLEKSISKNQEKTALIFNNERLTYRQLNIKANKLAHYLIEKGVKPETLVPVCLTSSVEQIIGIIAILKAGGAYVPIDPEYPSGRISYILNDCNATIIVTSAPISPVLKKLFSGEIIEIDKPVIPRHPAADKSPILKVLPHHLAYVMYTSGTTGVPNGVMIEHQSLANNLIWASNYFMITSRDVVLQKTSFTFDVSVWEIFWPLLSGAELVIVNRADHKNLERLKAAIMAHSVTCIHFVPTMLEFFLLSLEEGECPSLTCIVSSGEALTPFQANLTKVKIPQTRLYNLYGPTETTIHSTCWEVPIGDTVEKVLIGKPVAHTEVCILNDKNELEPEGITGEIYIGGRGLARGYLNNTVLTQSRFVEVFFNDSKKRLYKTGDFGRYLKDDNIEYLGRVDDQVKISGYRIELSSIEANIKNSGLVKHAVVLTVKNSLKTLQIVAYVVLNSPNTTDALWDHLVTKLPGYMLPTSISEVDHIPFTNNGKVDREALFKNTVPLTLNGDNVSPRTDAETLVMQIWTDLFKTEKLSINSNFFDLGGNSIMAVNMLARIKKETGTHISFLLLNQYPTIESLSKVFSKPHLLKIPNALVSINPGGSKPPLFLVNGGELVADGFFNLSDGLHPDQPVYGFQTNGFDNNGKRFENIEEIAAYYVKGILNHDSYGPCSIAGYSLGAIIAFEMAKQLKALGKDVKTLVMIDGLTRDPALIKTKYTALTLFKVMLLNVYLFRYGPGYAFGYINGFILIWLQKIKQLFYRKPIDQEMRTPPEKDTYADVFGLQIEAYKKYHLSPYDGNIVVLRADKISFYMDDFKYLGWKPYAKKIKSLAIKGDHYTIFNDSNIKTFGEKMQRILDEGF